MNYQPVAVREYKTADELRKSYTRVHRRFFEEARGEIMDQMDRDHNSIADLRDHVARQVAEMRELIRQTKNCQSELDQLRNGIEVQEAKIAALKEQNKRLEDTALIEGAKLDFKKVLEVVSSVYGLHPRVIKGVSRDKNVVAARRHIVRILTVGRPDLSLPLIGRLLGGRDHSTIIHARNSWPTYEHLYEEQARRVNVLLGVGQPVDSGDKPQ